MKEELYDKLSESLNDALSKETKESWEEFLDEEPVSEDLEEASNKYANTPAVNNPPFTPKEFIKVAFKAGAQWQKEKSIVDVCYHLEMRLPKYLDYNGARVERKDFIEDFKKALNED